MGTDSKNQELGDFIKARRLSRGLSLHQAATESGLHYSYWSKLEAGQYAHPAPKYLMAIAQVLQVRFEDLYGLVGYELPDALPSFSPYLRTKYGDLPPEAVADLERYFQLLRAFYNIPDDQPVFPPKPKDEVKKVNGVIKRRAA